MKERKWRKKFGVGKQTNELSSVNNIIRVTYAYVIAIRVPVDVK